MRASLWRRRQRETEVKQPLQAVLHDGQPAGVDTSGDWQGFQSDEFVLVAYSRRIVIDQVAGATQLVDGFKHFRRRAGIGASISDRFDNGR